MSLTPKTIYIAQRTSDGMAWEESYVSGSNLILQTDPSGSVIGLTTLPTGFIATSASYSVSASYSRAASTASLAITASYTTFDGIGGKPTLFSSSAQVINNLPSNTVSSSAQITYFSINGIPDGIVSSSAQVKAILPPGTVSGSAQIIGSLVGQNISVSELTASVIKVSTLVVETVSASVVFSSGSNKFGSADTDTQTFTGSVLMRGSVGIGVASPSEKLTIGGGVGISVNTSFVLNDNLATIRKQSDHGLSLKGSTGTTNDITLSTPAGQIILANPSGTNDVLFAPAAGGNVGIGTVSPTTKFEIAHSLSAPATSGAAPNGFQRLIDIVGSRVLDFGVSDTPSMAWIQSRDKNTYSVNYPLILNPNGGNVGIGTSTPSQLFDVNGNANIAGALTANQLVVGASASFAQNIQIPRQASDFSPGSTIGVIYTKTNSGGGTEDSLIFRSDGIRFEKYDGTLFGSIRRSGDFSITSTTSATSPTVGAVTIGNGTSATNVAIGGGKINAGGAITAGTTLTDQAGLLSAQRNSLSTAQGLVFNNTNSTTISVDAFGTRPFSIGATINWSDVTSNYSAIVGHSSNNNNFFFGVQSGTAILGVIKTGGSWISSGIVISPNTPTTVDYVRTSTGSNDARFYINGVLAATVTDANDYTVGLDSFGGNAGTSLNTPFGTIQKFKLLNYAASAAETLLSYQTGTSGAGDYNSIYNDANGAAVGNPIGAGQQMINGANSTFASDTGFWTLAGGTPATISGGVANFITGASYIERTSFLKIGSRYTVLVGALTGTLVFEGGTGVTYITAGVPITFVATQTTLRFFTAGGGTMDDVTLTPLGLLIAPEADANGFGSVWYDMSGNNSHITLPASGVDWLLKSTAQTVSQGGTGTGSFTTNSVLLGNGTSSVQSSGVKIDSSNTMTGVSGITMGGGITWTGSGQLGASTGTTTNNKYFDIRNTGGGFYFGVESSGGATMFGGGGAYATCFGTQGATSLQFATNGTVRHTVDGSGLTSINGSINISSGSGTFLYGALGRATANLSGVSSALLGLTVGSVASGYLLHEGTNIYLANEIVGSIFLSTNGVVRQTISSDGTTTLTKSGGGTILSATDGTVNIIAYSTGTVGLFGTNGAHPFKLITNGTDRVSIHETTGATTFNCTTSATSPTVGAVLIGNGTSATNVAIGGGNVNAGGTATSTGFIASSASSLYGLIVNRPSTSSFGGLSFRNANDGKWFVGMREVGNNNNFRFYSETLTVDVFTLSDSTGGATFAYNVDVVGNLTTGGGRKVATSIKTTTYTVTTSDHVLVGNHASTPFTITMIAASSNTGQQFIIKNKGVATVTVDATSLGTVDGSNTIALTTNQSATLVSDGVQWNRI